MNVRDIATQPIFVLSLALCALVATAGITLLLKKIFRKASNVVAFAGLTREEVISIEAAGKFHSKLEQLVELVLRVEERSGEAPGVFHDHSWARLLKMCDDLESARSELHELLGAKRFVEAAQLGRFLCGFDCSLPSYPRAATTIDLKHLTFWQRDSLDLLHRMVSKLEEVARVHDEDLTPRSLLSQELQDVIEDAKDYIDRAEFIQ